MRNISDKISRENQNTRFMFYNFFFSKIVPFMRERGKILLSRQATHDKWRVRIACWMPKATDTHSEYVILIAFPLQQWLHENVSDVTFIHTFPGL
jgi:hypothetical protein